MRREFHVRFCEGAGVRFLRATRLVVLCSTGKACEEAEIRVREVLNRLGLELHPDKTRRVDLSWGQAGFDFLGCSLRKRMSGLIWEKQGRRVYFLQRCPSPRSLKRVRQRVKEVTGRNRSGAKDVRVLIDALNPVLRGWGNYFRTGNATQKFTQTDTYVWKRLHRFMVKRKGRNLAGRGTTVGQRLLPSPGAAPPARDRPIPGGSVMPPRERPPVSRVPEIGMHGLKGGPTEMLAAHRESGK